MKRKVEDILAELSDDEIEELSKALNKRKKAEKAKKEEEKFYCDPQLITWYENDTLWEELDSRTTEELKGICYENNVPRSGPKYELRSRLIEHAKEAIRKREEKALNETNNEGAKYEFEVRKFKSFEAAFNHAKKLLDKIKTNSESMVFMTYIHADMHLVFQNLSMSIWRS
jgi:hypothetical protein